jgi:hypothetical protein
MFSSDVLSWKMSVTGYSTLFTARGTGKELARDTSTIEDGMSAFNTATEHGEVNSCRNRERVPGHVSIDLCSF